MITELCDKNVKEDGDPDLTQKEAEALRDEWERAGKPGPDKKRKRGGNDDGSGWDDILDCLIPLPDIPTCLLDDSCFTEPEAV